MTAGVAHDSPKYIDHIYWHRYVRQRRVDLSVMNQVVLGGKEGVDWENVISLVKQVLHHIVCGSLRFLIYDHSKKGAHA